MPPVDIDGLQAPHTETARLGVALSLLEEQTALACSDLPGHVWLELEEALRETQLLVLDARILEHSDQLDTLRRVAEIYLPQVINSCEPLSELPQRARDALTQDIEQRTLAVAHYLDALRVGLQQQNLIEATRLTGVLQDFFHNM